MEQNEPFAVQNLSARADSRVVKIVAISLALLAIIAVIGLVVINSFPELIFSPKNMYLMSEKNTAEYLEKQIDSYNKDAFVQDSLKVYNTPYKQQSDISLKLKKGNFTGPEAQQLEMINNILSNSKISLDESVDVKNDKSRAKVSVVVKGNKLIDVDAFMGKDQAGVIIPVLFNKYITLNPQDFRTAAEKLGISDAPRKIITDNDIINAIHIDKKELQRIQKDYIKFFTSNITNKDI
jgi:hypothetical protein